MLNLQGQAVRFVPKSLNGVGLGGKGGNLIAVKFHQNDVAADFSDAAPRNEYAVAGYGVFEKLFADRNDEAENLTAAGEGNVHDVAEVLAVDEVDDGFVFQFAKSVVGAFVHNRSPLFRLKYAEKAKSFPKSLTFFKKTTKI